MSTPEITYHDLFPENFEGLAWRDMERESPFDRMPITVKHLPHVWSNIHTPSTFNLSQHQGLFQ